MMRTKIRMESTTTMPDKDKIHIPPHLETQIGNGLGLDSIEVHATISRLSGCLQGIEDTVDGASGS